MPYGGENVKKLNNLVARNPLKIHHFESRKRAQTWDISPLFCFLCNPSMRKHAHVACLGLHCRL